MHSSFIGCASHNNQCCNSLILHTFDFIPSHYCVHVALTHTHTRSSMKHIAVDLMSQQFIQLTDLKKKSHRLHSMVNFLYIVSRHGWLAYRLFEHKCSILMCCVEAGMLGAFWLMSRNEKFFDTYCEKEHSLLNCMCECTVCARNCAWKSFNRQHKQ